MKTKTLLVTLIVAGLFVLPSASTAATVSTNKADYAPDEVVTISGSGFDTSTVITVTIVGPDGWLGQGEDGQADVDVFDSADFFEWVSLWEPVGSDGFKVDYCKGLCSGEFHVYVQDEAGNSTETTFTDSGHFDYSPTDTGPSVDAGGSVSFSQSVTAPKNNGSFTADVMVAGTGSTPIPASWVSTLPTSLSFVTTSSSGDTKSWDVTFTVPSGTAPGTYTAQIKADPSITGVGLSDGTSVTLTVNAPVSNTAPTAAFTWSPETPDEGSSVTFTDGSTDDGTILSWSWDFGDGGTSTEQSPSHTYADNGIYTVTLTVMDDGTPGLTDEVSHEVTVNNVAPTVDAISIAPSGVVSVDTPINASAGFSDPGILDTHTAEWDWGDGTSTGTVTETDGSGSVSDSHTYTSAGIYTVTLTVTDKDSGQGSQVFEYVVVYDPSAGFVTGGGWITSPAGAYRADTSLAGKANFGFVAKYHKGANVPDGNTEFQFKAGNLNFHSTSYDWLVVTGSDYARFKGIGTINGDGPYTFMLWAGDGGKAGDTFRIKIWEDDSEEDPVYDNGMDQVIDSGSIVVHAK